MWTSKRELRRRNAWQAKEMQKLLKLLSDNDIKGNWLMPGESRTINVSIAPQPKKSSRKGK